MKHTLELLVQNLSNQLSTSYHEKEIANQNAWNLLEKLTGVPRPKLILRSEITLSDEQEQRLEQWVADITVRNKPVQYILETVPFLDLELLVEPPVLIPRPETEEWCHRLIKEIKNSNHPAVNGTLLDLCTGCGCIALALAKALPHAHVYGTDISEEAIELAKKNAAFNSITNVTFLVSDVFANVPPIKFDLITANPPYIAPDEYEFLDYSVLKWEDKRALTSEDRGTAITQKIIALCPQFLQYSSHELPQLWMEIGHQQGPLASALFEQAGIEPTVYKDLYGNDRLITGKLKRE